MVKKAKLLEKFVGYCEDISQTEGLNEEALARINILQANFRQQIETVLADDDLNEISLSRSESKSITNDTKAMILGNIFGELIEDGPERDGPIRDLRGEQDLLARVLDKNTEKSYPILRRLKRAIGFRASNPLALIKQKLGLYAGDPFPKSTITVNAYSFPKSKEGIQPKFKLETILTGKREPGARPKGKNFSSFVNRFIDGVKGIKNAVSSKLGQGNQAFKFPTELNTESSGLEQLGENFYRSPAKADASITQFDPENPTGHFAAISGAPFINLIEMDEEGNAIQQAQVFAGPNNLFGSDQSVIEKTLVEGNFNLARTYAVIEHGEGDQYALSDTSKYETAIRNRYGDLADDVVAKIIPEGKKSTRFSRLGQQVFDLNAAASLELTRAGLDPDMIHVNKTCPTNSRKHHSNTVEGGLNPRPGFVSADSPIPAGDTKLWLRNGYMSYLKPL